MPTEKVRFICRQCTGMKKQERRMGRFKEFGKRRENLSTQGNYWQQDITASERCVMASKAATFRESQHGCTITLCGQ